MQAGLPIVATEVGGVSELIPHKDTGLLTPSRDQNALQEALTVLITNENARATLSHNAQIRGNEFNIERMLEETCKQYHL